MGKKSLALDYHQATPYDVVLKPERCQGAWAERFGRQAPLHVEIGMGLGEHLIQFASTHPYMNHVGLELKMHRIYTARQKALRRGVRHVRYVLGDANHSLRAFNREEVDRLTLLFPDPWSAERFARRRLTHPEMLQTYATLLKPGGHLHFRTDDPDLFDYTCHHLTAFPFNVNISVLRTRVLTDFEKRWLTLGRQIYGLDAWRH